MVLLFLFLGAMDIFVVTSQRKAQFDEVSSYIKSEMALAGTFISEAMLREEFSVVEQFVVRWGEKDKEILEFTATTPAGIVLAEFKREKESHVPLQVDHRVTFQEQHLLDLVMKKDLSSFEATLTKLRHRLLQRSLIMVILLGVISWIILKNLALRPLEEEIERRTEAEKELEKSSQELENRVAERTAELSETNINLIKEVAEHQQTTKELYNAKEEWERTFDAIGDFITIQDKDMRIVKVNKALCQELNATPGELIGKHCFEIFHDAELPCEGCVEVLCDKTAKTGIFEVFHPKLNKTLLVSRASIYDESNQFVGAIHISKDITRQKQLENQLQQSQKMEAVGTLAGGIAHDFNNILAAILGFSDLALLETENNGKIKDYLQSIKKSGKRAKDLVAQILAFSRHDKVEKDIVNIEPILKESLKLLRSVLPATIEIKQEIDSTTGSVIADPTQLHQIIMNLSTNASQAMEEKGGILTVSLSEEEFSNDQVVGSKTLQAGKYVKIAVTDTGQGMDDALLEYIFDPFFTTKEKTEGTGMGLSVVHGIMEESGGAIGVQSTPGEGTRFELFFPRASDTSKTTDSAVASHLKEGQGRILFIDDEADLVEMGEKMLMYLGYEVEGFTSSSEALESFRENAERFDLVITDQTMPEISGVELASRLLEISSDIPIILCTGYSSTVSEDTARQAGISEFVMKPLSIHQLSNIVGKVLMAA
jgi:PAS domain S-box-containing protein